MSWILALLGFMALILLHEAGHFAAAKAVGMRVERFSIFFPPLLAKLKRGETEYAIGAVPLGGYVKITGMNPAEDIPPEAAHRAYFRQPVWKRVFVISAGPAVNIVLAFVILAVLYLAHGTLGPPPRVQAVQAGTPAAGELRAGDAILAVDGQRPAGGDLDAQNGWVVSRISRHHGTPVTLTVRRDGRARSLRLTPFYDRQNRHWRLGFTAGGTTQPADLGRATSLAGDTMWRVTSGTVKTIAGIFNAEKRKQISGVVGSYETTRQAFSFSFVEAAFLLAVISLSLGVVNLFPFLPLDGGHIFWALAEKVRGRAIPFSVMERAGFVGFALVIGLFVIGFTNDIGRLTGQGFGVR